MFSRLLAELKVERNRDVGGPVLVQLERYWKAFRDLAQEYATILDQMQQLGLAANRRAQVDTTKRPIPVVMLAGLPVRKFGAPKDSRLLHSLQKKNREMVGRSPDLDARLLVFPRRDEQSFSIPTSLEDLPTIEKWCTRNLSDVEPSANQALEARGSSLLADVPK